MWIQMPRMSLFPPVEVALAGLGANQREWAQVPTVTAILGFVDYQERPEAGSTSLCALNSSMVGILVQSSTDQDTSIRLVPGHITSVLAIGQKNMSSNCDFADPLSWTISSRQQDKISDSSQLLNHNDPTRRSYRCP